MLYEVITIPKSKWEEVKTFLLDDLKTMKMGSPEDTSNFINAVIRNNFV